MESVKKQHKGVFYMKQGDLGQLGISLHHGDCLEVMKIIPDASVDLILADPP